MNLKSVYLFVCISLATLLLSGCAATYTIHLIDEESGTPTTGIPVKVLDENSIDQIYLDESNNEGALSIKLADIPGDSFLVSISGDDYFEINEWIRTPARRDLKEFILKKRITIITGWVLDDSTYVGIPECEITTMPFIMRKTTTDKEGKFILRSNEFAEMPYTIFADKKPDYIENSTELIPEINRRNNLEIPIYLKKVNRKEKISIGSEIPVIPEDPVGPIH